MEEKIGYTKELLSINLVKANLYAIFSFLPISIFYILPFFLIQRENISRESIKHSIASLKDSFNPLLVFGTIVVVSIIGTIVHELIHGITWAQFTKKGFKSIRFGIIWKYLTPYCHCKEPLLVKHYIFGGITPAILLGLLPGIVAIISGNVPLLLFAIFFTMAAMGDFMIIFLLRKENKNSYVQDHPSEGGCYIYRKDKNITN